MAKMEVPEEGAKRTNLEQKEQVAEQMTPVQEERKKLVMNKEAKVMKEVQRLEEGRRHLKKEFPGKAQEDLMNSPRLIMKPGRRIKKKNDGLVQQRINHFLTIKGECFDGGVGQRVGGTGMLPAEKSDDRKRRLSGRPNTPDKRKKVEESTRN
jgi:hypothetical protein